MGVQLERSATFSVYKAKEALSGDAKTFWVRKFKGKSKMKIGPSGR